MKPAYAYLRVSGKNQIAGDGFPRQRAAITAYAAANGYRIAKWFTEKAIPGKTEWEDRPAWTEMVGELNGVRTIFIERLDRLARDLMVQEHIIADLRRREIELISVAEPDLCMDDPGRKLMRHIMGAIAEYDRVMIVAKLAGARKRMKEKTGACEGKKPFGSHPGEAATLKRMVELRDSLERRLTFGQIADALNAEGLQSRTGKLWNLATVAKILVREARRSLQSS